MYPPLRRRHQVSWDLSAPPPLLPPRLRGERSLPQILRLRCFPPLPGMLGKPRRLWVQKCLYRGLLNASVRRPRAIALRSSLLPGSLQGLPGRAQVFLPQLNSAIGTGLGDTVSSSRCEEKTIVGCLNEVSKSVRNACRHVCMYACKVPS